MAIQVLMNEKNAESLSSLCRVAYGEGLGDPKAFFFVQMLRDKLGMEREYWYENYKHEIVG